MTTRLTEFDSSVPPPERRVGAELTSLNARLLSALLRHRHFLLRAENGVVRDVVGPLRQARRELVSELERIAADADALDDLSGLHAQRRALLERRIDTIISIAETDATKTLAARLEQVGLKELEIQENVLRRLLPEAISLNLVGPDLEMVRRLIESPLGGKRWGQRMAENYGELRAVMKRELATSAALGEGMDAAARRLRRAISQLGMQRSVLIARSEIQRVANSAARDLYRRNSDVIKAEAWVATLDDRTCPICGSLDGETWEIGRSHPTPPAHAQCRCFLSPVTRSWRELGIDRDNLTPGTRASMNGQVPGQTTYSDWFNAQSETFQRSVLGKGRFERFQSGGLTLDDMVKDLRVLPIDELPIDTSNL